MTYTTVGLFVLFVISHSIAYYLGYLDGKSEEKRWENTSDPKHPDFDKDGGKRESRRRKTK